MVADMEVKVFRSYLLQRAQRHRVHDVSVIIPNVRGVHRLMERFALKDMTFIKNEK